MNKNSFMRQPCKNCPFRKTNAWYGPFGSAPNSHSKIEAMKALNENYFVTGNDIFSCHMKNPDNTLFSFKRMVKNDCAGYAMMKENIKSPNKYPKVVNEFNETGPDFDLRYWAKKEGYISKLQLI